MHDNFFFVVGGKEASQQRLFSRNREGSFGGGIFGESGF
jgi:hypothetical protein